MIFGIDLGTTNSSIGIFDGQNRTVRLADHLDRVLIPSAVAETKQGEIVVGQTAIDIITVDHKMGARFFKRSIGTDSKFPVGSQNFDAVELSALVLQKLKDVAASFFNEAVKDVVISVPAYFNNIQRTATIAAAKSAGLNAIRLINEPTAAALAYSLQETESDAHIVVLDIGGGTFDISILEKFDDVMEIHASGGDNFLGGEDFTLVLLELIVSKFQLQKLSQENYGLIYKFAEKLKHNLNAQDEIEDVLTIGSEQKTITVSRQEFENAAKPLIERIQTPIMRTLRDANLKKGDITHVVLVGGASRMWFFKKLATSIFGLLPSTHIDPDIVVTHGAAMQAILVGENRSLIDKVMTDVSPFTLGVSVARQINDSHYEEGIFSPIIQRNQTIPLSRVETYSPIHDRQENMELEIYQGESMKVANNLKLGKISIPIEKKPATEEQIHVRFTYDISGVLEVEATVESTGQIFRELLNKNLDTTELDDINARFEKLANLKRHPKDQEENLALILKAERLYEEHIDYRDILVNVIDEFKRALATQEPEAVERARSILTEQLRLIEET